MLFEYKPLLLSDKVENCLIHKSNKYVSEERPCLRLWEKNPIQRQEQKNYKPLVRLSIYR